MTIRQLTEKDARAYLQLMLALDRESKFMLYEPGERTTTAEDMAEDIKDGLESGGVILGAFDANELVGIVSLSRGDAKRIRHSGYVVIGVLQTHGGKGIGGQLLDSLDAWAKLQEISKLELTVMCHNERAYDLYLRKGYVVEGTKKQSICIDGHYYDEYYMGKLL